MQGIIEHHDITLTFHKYIISYMLSFFKTKEYTMAKKKRRKRLPNGLGSVYKLSGNRYKPFLARKSTITLPDGSTFREVVGTFETYEEAYQALIDPTVKVSNATTLMDLFEIFKDTNEFKSLSQSTQSRYNTDIKKLSDICYTDIQKLRYQDLQKVIDKLETEGYQARVNGKIVTKKYSQDVLKKTVVLISKLYTIAVKNEIVNTNLAELIEISTKKNKKKFNIFTDLEIEKMFNNLDKHPMIRPILLAIFTGLRPVELVALEKTHYDRQNHTLFGMGAKTEAGRSKVVVLHPRVYDIVEYLYKNSMKYLIHIDNEKLTTQRYRRQFKQALEALNIPVRNPYATRDTCAALMNRYNVDKETIKNQMGHTSYSTTSDNYIPIDLNKNLHEIAKIQ